MPYFSLNVPETFEKELRLDKYIAASLTQFNRSKLKTGISEIRINGTKGKLSSKIRRGDKIEFEWEDNVPEDIEPQDIPLDILYEDENVTVINKKQGMVTHPAAGNWTGTLVNALLFHWNRQSIHQDTSLSDSQIIAARRPGIVHRLDKDTSGVIITARNRESEEWLQKQFANHNLLQKDYICICCGHPKNRKGIIETQIVRSASDRKKFKAVTGTSEGKKAVTLYRVIAFYGPYTLMRVRIKTGRTHQIRVHMKYLGCPVLGDSLYGKTSTEVFPKATLMLHAFKLKIRLPGQKKHSVFQAKVPLRFKRVLKVLHAKFNKT